MNRKIAAGFSPSPSNRTGRRRRTTSGFVVVLGMALSGAGLVIGNPAQAAVAQANTTTDAPASETNEALDTLAKSFARAMTDQKMRSSIHASVAERFDGDENVLWETLEDEPGVRDALEEAVVPEENISARSDSDTIDDLVSKVPRFQIAVPAKFDSWNAADYTPLVAFMPHGVEDTTLKTITAYDADGKIFELDAQVPPKRPVIVLGESERTDDSGALLSDRQTTSDTEIISAAAAKKFDATITYVGLIKDNEPWASGDAEIRLAAQSVNGCKELDYYETNWANLDNDGDVWTGKKSLGKSSCDVAFAWWEDDGASADFELTVAGFGLGLKMDDGDDIIGKKQFTHASFKGSTDSVHSWSGLQQHTQ